MLSFRRKPNIVTDYASLKSALQQAHKQANESGSGALVNQDQLDAISVDNEQLAAALEEAARQQDWLTFELLVVKADRKKYKETITDTRGYRQPTKPTAYVPILCHVLDERHDINNEDIIEALQLPADPRAIPSLARVLNDFPDWPATDEFGWAAVKAIGALEYIKTPEARQALEQAATSKRLRDKTPENMKVWEALQNALGSNVAT